MSMDAQDVHSQVMDGDPEDTPVYCAACHGEGVGPDITISHDGLGEESVPTVCDDCEGRGWVTKGDYDGDFPATRWP